MEFFRPEYWSIPFSRGSSQPRDWTQVSHIAGEFFTSLGYCGYLLFFPCGLFFHLLFGYVVLPVVCLVIFYWVLNIVCKNIEVQMMLFLPEKVFLFFHQAGGVLADHLKQTAVTQSWGWFVVLKSCSIPLVCPWFSRIFNWEPCVFCRARFP